MIFDRRAFFYAATAALGFRFPSTRACSGDLEIAERFLRTFRVYREVHGKYRIRCFDNYGQRAFDMTRLSYIQVDGPLCISFGFCIKPTVKGCVSDVVFIDDEGFEFRRTGCSVCFTPGDTINFSYKVEFNVGGKA